MNYGQQICYKVKSNEQTNERTSISYRLNTANGQPSRMMNHLNKISLTLWVANNFNNEFVVNDMYRTIVELCTCILILHSYNNVHFINWLQCEMLFLFSSWYFIMLCIACSRHNWEIASVSNEHELNIFTYFFCCCKGANLTALVLSKKKLNNTRYLMMRQPIEKRKKTFWSWSSSSGYGNNLLPAITKAAKERREKNIWL